MSEILFISHRIPFPPDRGDKIRSHHVVKRLARIAPVHIATFADDDSDMGEEVELAAMARSYKLVRRSKPLVLAGMQAGVCADGEDAGVRERGGEEFHGWMIMGRGTGILIH